MGLVEVRSCMVVALLDERLDCRMISLLLHEGKDLRDRAVVHGLGVHCALLRGSYHRLKAAYLRRVCNHLCLSSLPCKAHLKHSSR